MQKSQMGPSLIAMCVALLGSGVCVKPAQAEGWDGRVTLYGFLPAIDATIEGKSGATASTSQSISDVLDALKMAAFVAGEFHKDNYSILYDLFYSDLGGDGNLSGPLSTFVDVDIKFTMATLALGYDLVRDRSQMAQIYGGLRYIAFDPSVSLVGGGPFGASAELGDNTNFVQPLIGVRGQKQLNDKWDVSGFASLGGYTDGSNTSVDIYGGFDYAFSEKVVGNFGWRYLKISYEGDQADVDMTMSGPLIGIGWRF